MRHIITSMVAGSMLFAAGTAQARPVSDEARLERIVAGRVAAEPVDCIVMRNISSSEVISNTAIVYRMNDGTIMVNRPDSGARFLSRGDTLVTDTHSTQLCNVDIVRLYDSGLRMQTGSVGLGKFVPYPRPGRSARH